MSVRLEQTERGLELVTFEGLRLFVDFVGDRLHYQKVHRGKSELIAKAVGLAQGKRQIWDMTAGLAEDAWFLIRLGAEVTAFERQPLVGALLQDALIRAQRDPRTAPLASRLKVISEDSVPYLKKIGDGQGPEVIYLDPMFHFEKKKSALPRKEMQIFRSLVGADTDAQQLLMESLRVATDRVIVKRPLKEASLMEGVQHRFEGTRVRYDLYSPGVFRTKGL